eukprot:scaffold1790_cov257-Pinguiococcus_pyrenoidosus.AAC.38
MLTHAAVGPAKTPDGYASGSFGPTTAGRMDSYVGPFMAEGGSFITLAKVSPYQSRTWEVLFLDTRVISIEPARQGNRSKEVTSACKKYGGFYLGSIGGPAAILAKNCIKKVEVLEYPELGMEVSTANASLSPPVKRVANGLP